MRNLTIPEIEALLIRYPKAKRSALENFLGTVGNNPSRVASLVNMHADALSYKWNTSTVSALMEGIQKASQELRK